MFCLPPCPTGSSRTAHPGAPHFHITVRLIRATSDGEGEEGGFRKPGDEVWQVSDTRQPFQKRDVTLPEIVHSGQRRASRSPASLLEIVREREGRRGRKLLLFPLSTLPLLGLSATRDFFSKQCRRETLLIIFNNRCFKRFGKFVGDKKKEEKRERGRKRTQARRWNEDGRERRERNADRVTNDFDFASVKPSVGFPSLPLFLRCFFDPTSHRGD